MAGSSLWNRFVSKLGSPFGFLRDKEAIKTCAQAALGIDVIAETTRLYVMMPSRNYRRGEWTVTNYIGNYRVAEALTLKQATTLCELLNKAAGFSPTPPTSISNT